MRYREESTGNVLEIISEYSQEGTRYVEFEVRSDGQVIGNQRMTRFGVRKSVSCGNLAPIN